MTREAKVRGDGRRKLLDAAKALLWERGYENTSPRDVLDRSGIGQGSLYHHFPGKLDLASAALAEMVAEEMAAMDAIFAPGKPPLQRLEDYLTRQRQALRGCRIGRLSNETIMETPALRQHVAAYLDHVERLIRTAFAGAQENGDLPASLDAGAMGALFLSVIQGGFVLARAHWDAVRMDRALTGAEAMLMQLQKSQEQKKGPRARPL